MTVLRHCLHCFRTQAVSPGNGDCLYCGELLPLAIWPTLIDAVDMALLRPSTIYGPANLEQWFRDHPDVHPRHEPTAAERITR